jgi:hypothetical protein
MFASNFVVYVLAWLLGAGNAQGKVLNKYYYNFEYLDIYYQILAKQHFFL